MQRKLITSNLCGTMLNFTFNLASWLPLNAVLGRFSSFVDAAGIFSPGDFVFGLRVLGPDEKKKKTDKS